MVCARRKSSQNPWRFWREDRNCVNFVLFKHIFTRITLLAKLGLEMAKLGSEMAELGSEMAKLGSEMAKLGS